MNKSNRGRAGVTIVAIAVATILAGCASTPKAPPGSEAVRSKLTALKSQPQLAAKVPVVLEQAEKAVVLAETPQSDAKVAAHRVYLADRLVDTARATAETRLAEEQRAGIKQQSDDARLAARTREADAAQRAAAAARSEADSSRVAAENSRLAVNSAVNDANKARAEADSARAAASVARDEAETARMATEAARVAADTAAAAAAAKAQQQELERQIALLQAKTTERGIVLTLGDVLFASGSDQLKPGAVGHLDRLVTFMGMYADRVATIEGHTDSVGEESFNQGLSQRRADAVKSYLAGRGVALTRLTSIGKGETYPIAGNESAGGRQQNRRVEVVIGNDMRSAAEIR
jgi:outer membrane protein OmpA-like peptidoglycan-associated protein